MNFMETEVTLKDYLAILKRRYLYLVIPFSIIFAISIIISIVMPPVYQSTGVIMVEAQQIPDNLVQSTVTSYADERIEIITQRVMTRVNLLRIIDKFGLYGETRQKVPVSTLVKQMRELVTVDIISADLRGKRKRGKTTIAFKVSFEHEIPDLAYKVANEFVTLFLDENVKNRVARATETTDFLEKETQKLKSILEEIEDQVAVYKQENKDALPEHLSLHLDQLERAIRQQGNIEGEINAREEEKSFLDIDLISVTSGLGASKDNILQNPVQELARLETELLEKSAIYGSAHPDITSLKRKITVLKKKVGIGNDADTGDQILDPVVAKIETKIKAIESRIAMLLRQKEQVKNNIVSLENKIIQTPQVERGLKALSRGYENALLKYQEIKSKLMTAQLSESLEQEKKAERFSLLEPPVLPQTPIKPNRAKMVALGFFLALATGGGCIMLVEMINGSVYGIGRLTAAIQRQPLVIIPYIETIEEKQIFKRRVKMAVGLSGVGLVMILILIHFLYMPLDIVAFKVLARLS